MRDIGARGVTGPQAVLLAALRWWMDRSGFREAVLAALERTGAESLWAKDAARLGASLPAQWDSIASRFWSEARSEEPVRHMVEQAVLSWKAAKRGPGRAGEARAFVLSSMQREAGEVAASSPRVRALASEIEEVRRSRRRRRSG